MRTVQSLRLSRVPEGGWFFLGQGQPNRLLNLHIRHIAERKRLYLEAKYARTSALKRALEDIREGPVQTSPYQPMLGLLLAGGRPDLPIPEDAANVLMQVAAAPTAEEQDDMALIDSMFDPSKMIDYVPYDRLICGPSRGPRGEWNPEFYDLWHQLYPNIGQDPFFCPPDLRPSIPNLPYSYIDRAVGGPAKKHGTDYFGFDESDVWHDQKPFVRNALVFEQVWNVYPFPGFVKAAMRETLHILEEGVRTFIRGDIVLEKELVRIWITLAIVQNYKAIVEAAEENIERKEKKSRFNAIVTAVGITAIGLMLGAALVGTVAKAAAGILSYMSQKQRQDTAAGLMETAEQFQATDPGFATEIERAAQFTDFFQAQATAAGGMTPEQKAAAAAAAQQYSGGVIPQGPEDPEGGIGADLATIAAVGGAGALVLLLATGAFK